MEIGLCPFLSSIRASLSMHFSPCALIISRFAALYYDLTKESLTDILFKDFGAPIAQLDRAPDYESVGRVFESPWARQLFQRLITFILRT